MTLILFTTAIPIMNELDIRFTERADALLTSADPIVIEGNTELANHPLVTGSGTSSDPYLISDVQIDCRASGRGGIAIRNTTLDFEIRNVTIYASGSAPAIFIRGRFTGSYYYPLDGLLDNITIIGGTTQIYLNRARSMAVKNCNLSNPSGTGYIVYVYYGYDIFFTNNSFDAPSQWFYPYYAWNFYFRKNTGNLYGYYTNYFRYHDLANNTMRSTRWMLYSGFSSNFQGNNLTSVNSNQYLLTISDCNRIKIANNTLRGGKYSIFVEHPNTHSPRYNYYYATANLRFEFNLIEDSEQGIYFHFATGHAAIRYMVVYGNTFRNCSSYAINVFLGGHLSSAIWHNWFYSNNGAADLYSLSNAQCRDLWGQVSWNRDDLGNYWSDKNQPDENSDGFLDDAPYDLVSNRNAGDFFPVSNPYYDFEKPVIDILKPRGRYVENSYVNISWEAYDNLSGMKMVQIREGYNEWTNVTGRDHHPVLINKGLHRIEIRAVDKANIRQTTWVEIFLNETRSPIVITSPAEGEYLDSTTVDIEWTLGEGFVPLNMTFQADGGVPIEIDPYGPYSTGIIEGDHTFKLESWDHYGVRVSQQVEAVVDTTAPFLDILYPASGAVISNREVHFKWAAEDSSGIVHRRMKIDNNPFQEVAGDEYSTLLGDGSHTFTLIVEDRTRWAQERGIAFTISRNTSLHITGPRYSNPTIDRTHEITWEYTSNFDVDELTVVIDQQISKKIDSSLTSYTIELSDEGRHVVEVIGEDPVRNTVSDHIEIILDNTPPRPQSKNLADNQYLNSSEYPFRWGAVENYGTDYYGIQVDDMILADDLLTGEYPLDLSEGEHTITMIATDLAGNVGTAVIHVTVDLTPPELELVTPAGDILKENYVTFKWRGEDLNGISNYQLILDSGTIQDMDMDTSKSFSLDQGRHSLTIICKDAAGNLKTLKKDLIVDPAPPTVSFTGEIGDHINYRSILIRWSASDLVGLSNLTLTVNDDDYFMSVNSTEFRVDLDHGEYTVIIHAVDIAGWSAEDEMSFEIDLIPPTIEKTAEAAISGRDVKITWRIQNESIDDLEYTLIIDGNVSILPVNLGSGSIMLSEMDIGSHTVKLTVNDSAGNQGSIEWTFEVKKESSSPMEETGGGWIIILIVILLIMIVIGIGGWLAYRRSRDEEERRAKPTLPQRPEKLKIRGAPPIAGALSPAQHAVSAQHAQHAGSPHSYIKPKSREKRPDQRIAETSGRPHKHQTSASTQRIHSRDSTAPPPKVHIPDIDIGKGRAKGKADEIDAWDDAEEIDAWDEMEELEYIE